jgi:negative regulator of flagellin synthesis FlgM
MKINTPNTDAMKAYVSQSAQGVQLNNKDKEIANAAKPNAAPTADRVNISSTVRLMKDILTAVNESPDIRADKVNAVETSIEKGTYKPDLTIVADKLLSPNISDRI